MTLLARPKFSKCSKNLNCRLLQYWAARRGYSRQRAQSQQGFCIDDELDCTRRRTRNAHGGEEGCVGDNWEEDAPRGRLLKIWDLGKTDKRNQAPMLLRSAKVQPSNKLHPVYCFALSTSALSFLAIGLADGMVLLDRHLD
ncbi:hypothetical protein EDB19DRAFT_1836639 [Suillus lakei]|nr:hypothetical protein EDB19DRAFT_1836639 [Suillus lakei]